MSITAADATAITQSQQQSDIAIAVARKNLDVQEQQGAAAISLLQDAASLAKQGPITPGKGLAIDAFG